MNRFIAEPYFINPLHCQHSFAVATELSIGSDVAIEGNRLDPEFLAEILDRGIAIGRGRTRAGMAAAKRRGKHVGRPWTLKHEQIIHARKLIESRQETVSGMASVLGVDRKTLQQKEGRP